MFVGWNGSINSLIEGKFEGLNELEDIVGSGLFFVDIWDNLSVEVRM